MDLREKWRTNQFGRFLVCGGVAALSNFSLRIVAGYWCPYWASVVVAYALAMVIGFVLFRTFVFAASSPNGTVMEQAIGFTVVNLGGLVQTLVVSVTLANAVLPALHVMRWRFELAHLAGICAPVFTSFIGHKYWSFASAEMASATTFRGWRKRLVSRKQRGRARTANAPSEDIYKIREGL